MTRPPPSLPPGGGGGRQVMMPEPLLPEPPLCRGITSATQETQALAELFFHIRKDDVAKAMAVVKKEKIKYEMARPMAPIANQRPHFCASSRGRA